MSLPTRGLGSGLIVSRGLGSPGRVYPEQFFCLGLEGPALANQAALSWPSPLTPPPNPTVAYCGGLQWSGAGFVLQWKQGVWTVPITGLDGVPYSISGTGEDDIWIGVSNGFARPFRLYHWDGSTLTLQTLPNQATAINSRMVVRSWDRNRVWCAGTCNGHWRLWWTETAGATWYTLVTAPIPLTILPVSDDEIYLVGGSSWTNPGVYYWSPGTNLIMESASAGLPIYESGAGGTHNYCGCAWTGEDKNDIWVITAGDINIGIGAWLYRGKIGGPWTRIQRLDTVGGYPANYSVNIVGRTMWMDKSGILTTIASQHWVNPDLFMQGDPLAGPLQVVDDPGTTNMGSGEQSGAGGHWMMSDNGRGRLYVPATGWETPPLSVPPHPYQWSNIHGALVIAGGEPRAQIEAVNLVPDVIGGGSIETQRDMELDMTQTFACSVDAPDQTKNISLAIDGWVDAPPVPIGYVGGRQATGAPFILQYKGGVWSAMTRLSPGGSIYSIAAVSEDRIWVGRFVGAGGVPWVDFWNGTAWSQQSLPGAVYSSFNNYVSVSAFDENTAFCLASMPSTGHEMVWKTNDGGASWAQINNGYAPGYANLRRGDPRGILAVGADECWVFGKPANTTYAAIWHYKSGTWACPNVSKGIPALTMSPFYYHNITMAKSAVVPYNENDMLFMDGGSGLGGVGIRIWRGNMTAGFSLVNSMDVAGGYGFEYAAIAGVARNGAMDENGVMVLNARRSGSGGLILQGDPLAGPLVEVSTAMSSVAESESFGGDGFYFVQDNAQGYFFDGATWAAPPSTAPDQWGNVKGADVLSQAMPGYVGIAISLEYGGESLDINMAVEDAGCL